VWLFTCRGCDGPVLTGRKPISEAFSPCRPNTGPRWDTMAALVEHSTSCSSIRLRRCRTTPAVRHRPDACHASSSFHLAATSRTAHPPQALRLSRPVLASSSDVPLTGGLLRSVKSSRPNPRRTQSNTLGFYIMLAAFIHRGFYCQATKCR